MHPGLHEKANRVGEIVCKTKIIYWINDLCPEYTDNSEQEAKEEAKRSKRSQLKMGKRFKQILYQ